MNSDSYLLSIVAPIRNERNYISELIDSFAKINDSRVELLISDNHSDDGSLELVNSISVKNVNIVQPESRLSPFNHHVYAIKESSGKFVYPVGGDDYISADCIRLILKSLRPGVIVIPQLRCFDDDSGETIEVSNLETDVNTFFSEGKFNIVNYLKFINYDQLIFIVCEKSKLSHLQYIKPNTVETFATWSNIFVFSEIHINDVVFIDSVLMHKRYNKKHMISTFTVDQGYSRTAIFFKSLNSVYNSFVYLKTTKKFLKTFYLLFFNRYAFGYYSIKKRNLKVRKLLAFSPIYMVVLSPLLFLKNFCILLYKKAKKS
jgi:glycosyltransferase involved in cell wall biosynthesis